MAKNAKKNLWKFNSEFSPDTFTGPQKERLGLSSNKPVDGSEIPAPPEPRKKPSYFPLYWLVNRDPYNGVLKSLHNWVV